MHKLQILILVLIMLGNNNSQAASFLEQELNPIAKRPLGLKTKGYPVLNQLENTLYPGKTFSSDSPNKRLERLEIAAFGRIQKGNIKDRLARVEDQINSWAISLEIGEIQKQKGAI